MGSQVTGLVFQEGTSKQRRPIASRATWRCTANGTISCSSLTGENSWRVQISIHWLGLLCGEQLFSGFLVSEGTEVGPSKGFLVLCMLHGSSKVCVTYHATWGWSRPPSISDTTRLYLSLNTFLLSRKSISTEKSKQKCTWDNRMYWMTVKYGESSHVPTVSPSA